MKIVFKDQEHEKRFHDILLLMKNKDDEYHLSAAYLMALVPLVYNDVFDFKDDGILPEGLYKAWQTGSSRKATRLMFNLWNGYHQDLDENDEWKPSSYYAVDEIFSNKEYAPYFYEAIKLRFGWFYSLCSE